MYTNLSIYMCERKIHVFFLLWFYESLCSHNQSEEPKMKHKPVVLRWLLGTWASFLITWTSPLTDKVGITYLLRKMDVFRWVTALFVSLQSKTIHYFVKRSWGCKFVSKGTPRNPRTSNPLNNDDSAVFLISFHNSILDSW